MVANASNTPRKFLFETAFEPDMQAPREKPVEAPPEPKYFDEDLARARAEGMSAGEEAGRQAALQGIEQATARALAAIERQLPALQQDMTAVREQQTRAAVEVSTALVRKIFPRLARDRGLAELEAVVADAMARLRDEPRIVIRVCDAMLDSVKERVGALAKNAGFEGRMVFLAENDMPPGDVRIEWADGGIERDTKRLWQEIEDTIRHMTGALKAPEETAPPTPRPADTQGAAA